jgi:hypothetical protein
MPSGRPAGRRRYEERGGQFCNLQSNIRNLQSAEGRMPSGQPAGRRRYEMKKASRLRGKLFPGEGFGPFGPSS